MESIMAHLIHSVLPVPPRNIVYIHPDDSVKKCIELMTSQDIGALVVIDNDKKLIGLVSERDIIRSCLYKSLNPSKAKASEITFTEVTILSPHDVVEKAMQAMTATKRRHVLIRDNDELIAILSIGDMLYYMLDDKSRVIEHLEHYIYT
jgi:CBS domain-containing protein